MKKIAILIIFLLVSSVCGATTYYVDATDGNDSKSGESAELAWKTISQVNSGNYTPGDTISFQCGETWREQLAPPDSGNATGIITFNSYGTGDAPIINGSNVFTNAWTDQGGGIYRCDQFNADEFFEDNIPLTEGSAYNELSAGEWYYDGVAHGDGGGYFSIYYYPSTGVPGEHVLGCIRPSSTIHPGVNVTNRSYITISEITFKNCHGVSSYESDNSTNITVQNCTFEYCYIGIIGKPNNGNYLSDFTISNNTFNYCKAGILMFAGDSGIESSHTITGNTLNYIGVRDDNNTRWNLTGDEEAISFQNGQNNIATSNKILNGYTTGFVLYTHANQTTSGNVIKNNLVQDNQRAFLRVLGASAWAWNGNVISHNVADNISSAGGNDRFAIDLYVGSNSSSMNYLYNNTIYKGEIGVYLASASGNYYLTAKNNLFSGQTAQSIYVANTNTSEYVFDYNHYDKDVFYYDSENKTLATWKSSASQDANSPAISDPLFANAASGDFTLQASSPCIGEGEDLGTMYDDALSPDSVWPDGVVTVRQGVFIKDGR
jgi:hypothetical protein